MPEKENPHRSAGRLHLLASRLPTAVLAASGSKGLAFGHLNRAPLVAALVPLSLGAINTAHGPGGKKNMGLASFPTSVITKSCPPRLNTDGGGDCVGGRKGEVTGDQ